MADQLGLGKRLDAMNLNVNELSATMEEMLENDVYLKRAIEFSKVSRKYNGSVNGSNEIIKFLKVSKND